MSNVRSATGAVITQETLAAVKFHGHSIADILDLTIEDALPLLTDVPLVRQKLQTLVDVGLGYVHLGQSATTLSGGEAQRMKLARELSKRQTGRTLYLLDEPTTGLHFDDVRKLLEVLHRLTDLGNSIIIIEHNLDVIRNADWILDLGPEGGEDGGRLVGEGRPAKIAHTPGSYTGQFLARYYASHDGSLEPVDDTAEFLGKSVAAKRGEPAAVANGSAPARGKSQTRVLGEAGGCMSNEPDSQHDSPYETPVPELPVTEDPLPVGGPSEASLVLRDAESHPTSFAEPTEQQPPTPHEDPPLLFQQYMVVSAPPKERIPHIGHVAMLVLIALCLVRSSRRCWHALACTFTCSARPPWNRPRRRSTTHWAPKESSTRARGQHTCVPLVVE